MYLYHFYYSVVLKYTFSLDLFYPMLVSQWVLEYFNILHSLILLLFIFFINNSNHVIRECFFFKRMIYFNIFLHRNKIELVKYNKIRLLSTYYYNNEKTMIEIWSDITFYTLCGTLI